MMMVNSMTKLEQLLNDLCPDGVEYKKLGDIAVDIFRGAGIKRDQVTEEGTPCVRYGEIYTTYGIYFDTCVSHTDESMIQIRKYFEHGDILFAITGESVEEIAKSTAYVGYDKCLAGGDIVVLKHNQNPKYLSYVLSTTSAQEQKSKGKVKSKVVHSSVPAIKDTVIPVPPLEVQAEIVRILDNFTELTARKKQYEYYRDELLTYPEVNFQTKTLDQISNNCDSQRKPITGNKRNAGIIPYYGASGIVDYVEDYLFDGDYLLVSEDGANLIARKTPIAFSISGKTWVNNHAHILQFNNRNTMRFVEIYLNSIDLSSYITGAAQPKLNQQNLNKIPIPYPPLEVQERIVNVLDNFEAICSDLQIGLPSDSKGLLVARKMPKTPVITGNSGF